MAMNREEILKVIKEKIIGILPDARIMLFGSRARGDWHEESDWDVLVLTNQEVTRELDDKLFDVLYPIVLEIFNPINFILVNENEWLTNPAYLILSHETSNEKILL